MPTPTKFGRHPSPRSLVILRADRHTHTHPGDHNICSVIGAQGVSPMKHAAFMKPYVFRSVRKQTSCKGLGPWKTADTETAKIDDLPPSIIISARGAALAYNGRRIDFRRSAEAYSEHGGTKHPAYPHRSYPEPLRVHSLANMHARSSGSIASLPSILRPRRSPSFHSIDIRTRLLLCLGATK